MIGMPLSDYLVSGTGRAVRAAGTVVGHAERALNGSAATTAGVPSNGTHRESKSKLARDERASTSGTRGRESTNGRANGHEAAASRGEPAEHTIEVLSFAVGRASLRYSPMRRQPALARGIEAALLGTPGVNAPRANPVTARVVCHFDPALTDLPQIEAAIRGAEPMEAWQVQTVSEDCCGPNGCEPGCADACCLGDTVAAGSDDCCAIGSWESEADELATYRKRKSGQLSASPSTCPLFHSTTTPGYESHAPIPIYRRDSNRARSTT